MSRCDVRVAPARQVEDRDRRPGGGQRPHILTAQPAHAPGDNRHLAIEPEQLCDDVRRRRQGRLPLCHLQPMRQIYGRRASVRPTDSSPLARATRGRAWRG